MYYDIGNLGRKEIKKSFLRRYEINLLFILNKKFEEKNILEVTMSVQIDMPVTLYMVYSYMAIKKLKRSQGRQHFFEGERGQHPFNFSPSLPLSLTLLTTSETLN